MKLSKGEIVSVTFLCALYLVCQFRVIVSRRPYISKCVKEDLLLEIVQAFGRPGCVKEDSTCVQIISGILDPKPLPIWTLGFMLTLAYIQFFI